MPSPIALTIAGSDPSGGAGIQADLKTFHQFKVYGQAVVTLITVQNTMRVSRIETLPADLVMQQVEAILDDMPPAAAKTGALGTAEIIEAVAGLAANFSFPLVVDPVMVSKHGARLLPAGAEEALQRKLLPMATLVTPNIPEAEALAGTRIHSVEDMEEAARRIGDFGCQAVLVKGGHLAGEPVDILHAPNAIPGPYRPLRLPGRRVVTSHTHGTGCTYSAGITAALALGHSLPWAVAIAREYIQRAIESAPGLGCGAGPVNHFAAVQAADQRVP